MNEQNRIISPQMEMRNKAALIMAYRMGATDENAKEIAQHFKIVEIDNFIEELVRREMDVNV